MTIVQAVTLGLIQGVTEFLPISSSGHLAVFQNLFGLDGDLLIFDTTLHVATLLAIVLFFFKDILKLRFTDLLVLGVGTIPAVLFGLFVKDYMEVLFGSIKLVGVALIVTGVLNFITDKKLEVGSEKSEDRKKKEVDVKSGFLIGLFQAFAITPGISRSGSTVAGASLLGLSRQDAFKFSFLLGIPAIAGAGLLQAKDLITDGFVGVPVHILAIGAVSAFVSGLMSLFIFKYVIDKARFEVFGWYCVVLGGLVVLLPL